ncbi:unnamed protein product, partial [Ectocarpus fasciculatus]
MVPDKVEVEVSAAGTTAAAAAAAASSTEPPSPTGAAVGDVAAVAATTAGKSVDAAAAGAAADGEAAIDGGSGEAAAAAAAEQEGGEGEGEQEGEMAVFLTVHPPQTTAAAAAAAPLVLEPLGGMELVMQVRQLLGEIPQTCLYSAFRLVALTPEPEGSEDGTSSGGRGDAVWKREGDVMNDFVELRSIPAVAARPEKVEVRVELEAYTVNTARQH